MTLTSRLFVLNTNISLQKKERKFIFTLTKPNETSKRSLKLRSFVVVNVNTFKVFSMMIKTKLKF